MSQLSARPGRRLALPDLVEDEAVVDVGVGEVGFLGIRLPRIEVVDVGADPDLELRFLLGPSAK